MSSTPTLDQFKSSSIASSQNINHVGMTSVTPPVHSETDADENVNLTQNDLITLPEQQQTVNDYCSPADKALMQKGRKIPHSVFTNSAAQ